MKVLLVLATIFAAAGCDGQEEESLTADDYVPEDVRAEYGNLSPEAVTCLRASYVTAARTVECSQDQAQVRFVENLINSGWMGHCTQIEMNAMSIAATEKCYQTWANADCGELESPGPCRVSQDWENPGFVHE